jgi:DNA-binding MarR family transcriptional regulator
VNVRNVRLAETDGGGNLHGAATPRGPQGAADLNERFEPTRSEHPSMTDDPSSLGFDEEPPHRLIYTVGRLDRVLRSELRHQLRDVDLTISEFTTLTVLRRRKGLSNAQLARRAMVTAQAMNQVLASLEQKGLVLRSSVPGTDTLEHHRARSVGLTETGEAYAERCDEIVASVEDAAFRRLDNEARGDLAATLRDATDELRDSAIDAQTR